MTSRLLRGDVLSFARHYHGLKFHALLCDAPYHLYSIADRFGADNAVPANGDVYARSSRGFMGKHWDGGDVAMNPEIWRALAAHLLPGAFLMVFAGTLNDDLISVSLRQAGLVKFHKAIYWGYGSGFPKATRIDTQIDRAAGANGFTDISQPVTSLARTWAGHRYGLQALKPAAETILIFRKPYEGLPVDSIVQHGAGALNVEAGRIGTETVKTNAGQKFPNLYGTYAEAEESERMGRWPANLLLSHSPDCARVGETRVAGYVINRFTDGLKPFGGGAGHSYESEQMPDEIVTVWRCADDCPVRCLGEQSGDLTSGDLKSNKTVSGFLKYNGERTLMERDGDSGTAARFFFNADYTYEQLESANPVRYEAKAASGEREAGLDERSSHPTHKPIALTRYLSSLLLPPVTYAPRRILIPFAGVASEMIGAMRAGWEEIVGVESEAEYVAIGKARLHYWAGVGVQQELFG